MPKLHPSLLLPLLLLLSGLVWGEAEDDQRWYKVELMVFTHEGEDPGSEQWEATPQLRYPDEFRFLIEPEKIEANLAAHPGESTVDEYGRQIITLLPEPTDSAELTTDDSTAGAELEPTAAAGAEAGPAAAVGAAAPDPNAPPSLQAAEPPLTPTPFVILPASERTFPAAYMRRSGRYDPLFHQAWYQPVVEESEALSIVIDHSGDRTSWPRLQGSVKLYLSRYLHIETNLWLNTDGHYLPGQWRMPAPPLGPPSLIVEEPAPPELLTVSGTVPVPAPFAVEGTPLVAEREVRDFAATTGPAALPDPNQPGEETGPFYPYRHAVLMQQKRRMRSTEIHYLDHPLFGVVVTLTPLTAEELEALARAEAGLTQDTDATRADQAR